MPKQVTVIQQCAACNEQWKKREAEVFSTGAKTIPFVSAFQLLSHFGKKQIKLTFCDKHGNNLRAVTRYVNKTGMLQIRNVITSKWRNATTLGRIVE